MTASDRHGTVTDAFNHAVQLSPEQREGYLEELAHTDPSLADQVRLLLKQDARDDTPLDRQSLGVGDAPLAPGTLIGHFLITRLIGEGGMGRVYEAKRDDHAFDQRVAIKVLHRGLSPDVVQRFRHERQILAKRNHPHITALIDGGQTNDGREYLVMEYVDGQTVAGALKAGPFSVSDVVRYGLQLAEVLECLHDNGIYHRDLKPTNIMLAGSGVKLLDFGVAKLNPSAASGDAPSSTAAGTLLGTLHYMSPEQLDNATTDARTDIFGLGLVLYEMATGRRAFEGRSEASVIASILKTHPRPATALQPRVPRSLSWLIDKCLAKDPADRWQTMRDLRSALEWAKLEPDAGPAPARSHWRERSLWAGLGVMAASIAFLLLFFSRLPFFPADDPVTKMTVSLPSDQMFIAGAPPLVLSRDGASLVYAADRGGRSQLFIRRMNQFETRDLDGTIDAQVPFMSPAGTAVGFVADGQLQRIDLDGSNSRPLVGVPRTVLGAAWGSSGQIVYTQATQHRVFAIPSTGGAITEYPLPSGILNPSLPSFLPDGEHVLLTVEVDNVMTVGILSLASGAFEPIDGLDEGSGAVYSDRGYIVYFRSGSLFAAHFDPATHTISGGEARVVDQVYGSPSVGGGHFALSDIGTLIYRPDTPSQLVWVTPDGRTEPVGSELRPYWYPRLSPDGAKIAVARRSGPTGRRDIWVIDTDSGAQTRITFEHDNILPIWETSGDRLTFASSGRDGPTLNIYSKLVDGNDTVEPVLRSELDLYPMAWSRDGRTLAYYQKDPDRERDIWAFTPDSAERVPVISNERFNEKAAALSPNGRWLAYVSNRTGRDNVHVASFPEGDPKQRVSVETGSEPLWSQDGLTLYFRAGRAVMAAQVQEDADGIAILQPDVLFEGRYDAAQGGNRNYDVTSTKPSRLLMLQTDFGSATQLNVVLNWHTELEPLLAGNR